MTYRITAPVAGYTGTVAGVTLANGTGETNNESAVSYFRRHGYTVEEVAQEAPAETHDAGGQVDGGGDPAPSPALPPRSASKADWKAHAIASGMSEEDAETATRDQLADRYHTPKEGPDA